MLSLSELLNNAYDTTRSIVSMGIKNVTAGAAGSGTTVRATVTVGTSVLSMAPPGGSTWQYLLVVNNGIAADPNARPVISYNINADPTASANAPTSAPAAGDWGNGGDVAVGSSVLIPLTGTITTIRVKSDTASTLCVFNLIK